MQKNECGCPIAQANCIHSKLAQNHAIYAHISVFTNDTS